MTGIDAGAVPPARVVAPFLVAAPLGLALAGIALAFAEPGTLDAPRTPTLLAATHGAILGWLTLSIMGATLQLVPSVLGGRTPPGRLAMAAFLLQATGVVLMVSAFGQWRLPLLALGSLVALAGIAAYLTAAARPLWTASVSSPALTSLRLAHLGLALTALVGVTWAFALHRGWFAVTPGMVGAHAHLGLLTWLAVSISGVTYRLLPMFGIVRGVEPRWDRATPRLLTALAFAAFAILMFEPPAPVRLALALVIVAAGALWLHDAVRLFRHRLRRRPDLYSRATVASFWFLGATLMLTPLAAASPIGAQQLQIACGFLFIGGWAGSTLVANSYKIVPFIAWYHRYSARAGTEWTPGTADLYSSRFAHLVLLLVVAGTILGTAAAFGQATWLLRLAGTGYAVAGLVACATLAWPFIARPTPRPAGQGVAGPLTSPR
jgi:hypothetical protein